MSNWKSIVFSILAVLTARVASADEPMPNITVEAERQRAQLRHDVDVFVSSAVSIPRGSDQVFSRWAGQPICPMVAGLSRQAGEFILGRLSTMAKDAGAPLGSEHCKSANLFVIVPPDAEKFVAKLKGYRGAFNYEASKTQIEEFEKARPVRVWFNEGTVNLDGTMAAGFLDTSGPRGKAFGYLVNQLPSQYGSRLNASMVNHNVLSVIEIVDRKMVASVEIGRLADYMAMVGLIRFDLDMDLGAAPTILNLFRADNADKPSGATSWDRALLHALYTVNPSGKMAVSDAQAMVLTSISSAPASR